MKRQIITAILLSVVCSVTAVTLPESSSKPVETTSGNTMKVAFGYDKAGNRIFRRIEGDDSQPEEFKTEPITKLGICKKDSAESNIPSSVIDIEVSPTISDGEYTISVRNSESTEWEMDIYSVNGSDVFHAIYDVEIAKIDIRNQVKGQYIVVIRTAEQEKTVKVIKR
ncbi:MAG: T9SS type A sorting domain-containing protein [Paludibacteraceae bacterium]|nr:T9SS type A sorting domain-containing protein [Paludibacteraceae bacterium]